MNDDAKRKKLLAQIAIKPWPDLGVVFSCGRNAAYQLVRSREVPSVRVGRKILVPTAPLKKMLGVEEIRA